MTRPDTGAARIREKFLRFFEERGHQRVPSSSLIPAQDPTLLFTNAGMNQFKDVFLGREERPYRRAATSQKCMRVSGKHNDLDQVGRTPRHHTFFEMLGNFSFGDYFKKEAIAFAWELMEGVFALPKDRLWVTIFKGDDESFEAWHKGIGLPPGRIVRLGEKDNFWSMGDTGPCGPCSEIHYDRGETFGCGEPGCAPGCEREGCERYMELWNLVFMQYDRQPGGELKPLAKTGVDTGMGLERLASVLQGAASNYETDLFAPIMDAAARLAEHRGAHRPDPGNENDRVALRVIADHVRAMVFLMADGAVPGNDGRGYVLRRIMRRAIRFGRTLGIETPFLCDLAGTVIEVMESAYPDLVAHGGTIARAARREEERFGETLAVGLTKVEALAKTLKADGRNLIPGAEAFRLYDTFGLPLDLIKDVAHGWHLGVDEAGFEEAMEEQRERSRRGMKETVSAVPEVVSRLPSRSIDFVGHETTVLEASRVLALVRGGHLQDELRAGEEGQVLLDRTPFYAEGGGQVGDTGFLTASGGVAQVRDTQAPLPGLNLHDVVVKEGRLRTGEAVRAEVDRGRREAVMRSHDSTHLLHAALRDVVGLHVKQAGSLVNPDRFRFDFSHYAALSDEILAQVEDEVNDVIRQDLPIRTSIMPLDEALRRGALAFFGDKYGATVRVVEVPGFSLELCGGTHAQSTGSIGLLKVIQERGIAAGVRRIEALAGEQALRQAREDQVLVGRVQATLNVERQRLHETLQHLLEQNRALQREVDQIKVTLAAGGPAAAADETADVAGVKVLVRGPQEGLDKDAVRALVDRSRQRLPSGVIVQWAVRDDRVTVTASVSRDLIPPLHAGEIVKELALLFDGRGGGKPDMAEAGGKSPADLKGTRGRTLEAVERVIRRVGAAR
ncbi:MAG TPA: alanine--tRNA ligase [Candidatus Polarisedimenticolia bacterium]|jgi:alanyl-tRNA synthetase|nr:alanine--tRNA ligase [Candidatus Polarisedimenticolia bacterium]